MDLLHVHDSGWSHLRSFKVAWLQFDLLQICLGSSGHYSNSLLTMCNLVDVCQKLDAPAFHVFFYILIWCTLLSILKMFLSNSSVPHSYHWKYCMFMFMAGAQWCSLSPGNNDSVFFLSFFFPSTWRISILRLKLTVFLSRCALLLRVQFFSKWSCVGFESDNHKEAQRKKNTWGLVVFLGWSGRGDEGVRHKLRVWQCAGLVCALGAPQFSGEEDQTVNVDGWCVCLSVWLSVFVWQGWGWGGLPYQWHISVRLSWTRTRCYLSRFYCKADRSLSSCPLLPVFLCFNASSLCQWTHSSHYGCTCAFY